MKTKLLKKFAILSLGLMGLFLIGNNLYAIEDNLGTARHVECRCSIISLNDKCLAKNWGSICGGGFLFDCQELNSNCGGV
jgi:hypothetical protein